jgi:hypothetical protein
VLPLGQQVKVELPERGPIPVGIIDHHHDTIWISRLQPIGTDPRPLHHPGEHPSRMHAAHLDPLLAREDDHTDRTGTPPSDHHPVAAVTVPLRVSAQQAVRIVVLASDQTVKVRAIPHQAKINR